MKNHLLFPSNEEQAREFLRLAELEAAKFGVRSEQAQAWLSVADTLNDVTPGWLLRPDDKVTAAQCAVKAIEDLAYRGTRRLTETLNRLGYCTECMEAPIMDEEGPFAYCACGTREDYGELPLQKLQLLHRYGYDVQKGELITRHPNVAAVDVQRSGYEVQGGDGFIEELVRPGLAEAEKAMGEHPQPTYTLTKVAEEAGEVHKAGVHCAEGRESYANLRGEMVQLIAMLYRLWVEGDQVHKLAPVNGTCPNCAGVNGFHSAKCVGEIVDEAAKHYGLPGGQKIRLKCRP